MGRTFSPSALKRAASGRGYDVIKGIIGEGCCRGDNDGDAGGRRCVGSDKISGMIGVDEWWSLLARVVVRCPERAKTWRESCKGTTTLATPQGV